MKPLSILLTALFFISCEGDPGPVGPEGPPGPVGKAFEVEANFSESNNYEPEPFGFGDIEVLDSDIVAVYWLWDVDENAGDVWQPLPATIYFNDGGEIQYGFDHTSSDVQLFMLGNVDLGTVGDEYTQGQIFKVVILPVDYVESSKIDMSNLKEVMKAVDQSKVERLHLR